MRVQWVLTICAAALLAGCGQQGTQTKAGDATVQPAAPVTELQKIDIVKGTGEGVSQGQVAIVHYTGWLYDPGAPQSKGTKFDSSRDRGRPFPFVIGNGDVIRGWDEGVQGMQPGGQRRLLIPSEMAYGTRGKGPIPPNTPLVFDVELLEIQEPSV